MSGIGCVACSHLLSAAKFFVAEENPVEVSSELIVYEVVDKRVDEGGGHCHQVDTEVQILHPYLISNICNYVMTVSPYTGKWKNHQSELMHR